MLAAEVEQRRAGGICSTTPPPPKRSAVEGFVYACVCAHIVCECVCEHIVCVCVCVCVCLRHWFHRAIGAHRRAFSQMAGARVSLTPLTCATNTAFHTL